MLGHSAFYFSSLIFVLNEVDIFDSKSEERTRTSFPLPAVNHMEEAQPLLTLLPCSLSSLITDANISNTVTRPS